MPVFLDNSKDGEGESNLDSLKCVILLLHKELHSIQLTVVFLPGEVIYKQMKPERNILGIYNYSGTLFKTPFSL